MDWAAALKKNKNIFVVLHGLQKPAEHYKTSSAERPVF
jgi:hypothetical protein